VKDRHHWTIRLAAAAESDIDDILTWTVQQFGKRQARIYATTLNSAISALTEGPEVRGVKHRNDIARGLLSLHVAQGRRKGRHLVLFRIGRSHEHVIEVLRILHDVMDLPRHLDSTTDVED